MAYPYRYNARVALLDKHPLPVYFPSQFWRPAACRTCRVLIPHVGASRHEARCRARQRTQMYRLGQTPPRVGSYLDAVVLHRLLDQPTWQTYLAWRLACLRGEYTKRGAEHEIKRARYVQGECAWPDHQFTLGPLACYPVIAPSEMEQTALLQFPGIRGTDGQVILRLAPHSRTVEQLLILAASDADGLYRLLHGPRVACGFVQWHAHA